MLRPDRRMVCRLNIYVQEADVYQVLVQDIIPRRDNAQPKRLVNMLVAMLYSAPCTPTFLRQRPRFRTYYLENCQYLIAFVGSGVETYLAFTVTPEIHYHTYQIV